MCTTIDAYDVIVESEYAYFCVDDLRMSMIDVADSCLFVNVGRIQKGGDVERSIAKTLAIAASRVCKVRVASVGLKRAAAPYGPRLSFEDTGYGG